MLKVLFVCSLNRMRSVTAERIFRDHPNLDLFCGFRALCVDLRARRPSRSTADDNLEG
jgi:predicted protein tyrosine phosphatase